MNLKKFIKLCFYMLLITLTLIYIIYRIFFTVPTVLGIIPLFFSILVLFVEIWDAVEFIIYTFNILAISNKKIKIPSITNFTYIPDIDILIATINENTSILENTINACKNLNYPDKSKIHIYICDDGNRKEVKELSKTLNINYISRKNNANAKAGNYNHALQICKSPFIATFDADMAPTPNFLLTTLPIFLESKEKIGFVQLPQSFINPDIFQYRFNLTEKIPFEQDYFYKRIQLAKNKTNSTIYCGTNTLFAREALDSCNGFATGTISEDIATGMLIEAKGFKGIALDNVEAYGICVNDLDSFLKQRSRWARGCIQILKKYKILKNKGLSMRQKLEYLSCISYWFFGFRRMIYLLTPLLFSIFGIIIIDCNLLTFLALWIPNYVLKRFALDALEGRKRSSTWNSIYETILTPVLFKETIKELFGFGSTKFEVTPKMEISSKMSKANKKLLTSHLIILILNIIGLIMCLIKIPSNGISIYILSLIWIISNIFYLLISVIFDLRIKKHKYDKFVPNKVSTYGRLSIFNIFINIFKK